VVDMRYNVIVKTSSDKKLLYDSNLVGTKMLQERSRLPLSQTMAARSMVD
jgi:hypothetical protein